VQKAPLRGLVSFFAKQGVNNRVHDGFGGLPFVNHKCPLGQRFVFGIGDSLTVFVEFELCP